MAFGNTRHESNNIVMKKSMMVMGAFLMVCCFTKAKAQVMGVKGGFSIADISSTGGNSRTSGHVGLFFNSLLTKSSRNWYIQPEIMYSGEGERFQTPVGDRVIALSYINVPVMFQYYPARQVYVEAGPQLGMLVGAADKDPSRKINVMSDYNKFALSAGLGVGIQATDQIGFDARYNFGLTNIVANTNFLHYSNVLQVGVAVRIK
jgi:hypothetical protein